MRYRNTGLRVGGQHVMLCASGHKGGSELATGSLAGAAQEVFLEKEVALAESLRSSDDE